MRRRLVVGCSPLRTRRLSVEAKNKKICKKNLLPLPLPLVWHDHGSLAAFDASLTS